MIKLSQIKIDGGTQTRVELSQATVSEYAEAMRDGAQFPPIVVYFDGSDYWLADGFHRYFAAKEAGLAEIFEERIPGTQRDAILHSLGANAKHGLRRSNADKRRAVETMLADPEWSTWSSREVARACGVGHQLVEVIRKSSLDEKPVTQPGEQGVTRRNPSERTYTTKHGTTATMNTASIGKAFAASERPAVVEAAPQEGEQSEPEQSEVERLNDVCDEQAHHLKEIMAENESMSRVFESDDRITAALAEVKRVSALNDVLQSRVTGLTNERSEAIRLAKNWKRRAERAEAELARIGG